MTRPTLVELAQKCPFDYPMHDELCDIAEVVALSKAPAERGFTHLAKAVFGGIAWSRKIGQGRDIEDLERGAAEPGWTWNRKDER